MSQASIFVEIKSAWPLSARDDLSELCAKDSWTADVELDKAVGQLSCRQIEALALTQLDVFRLSKLQSARAQASVQLKPAFTEHPHNWSGPY